MTFVAIHANNEKSLTEREKGGWGHHFLFGRGRASRGLCVCVYAKRLEASDGVEEGSGGEKQVGANGGRS